MIYRTGIGLDARARSIAAAAFVPETGAKHARKRIVSLEARTNIDCWNRQRCTSFCVYCT